MMISAATLSTSRVLPDGTLLKNQLLASLPDDLFARISRDLRMEKIEVGDIVYLREDEQVPCDLVLLKSSGADGSCFITTTNLDGETNLKQRQAPAITRDWDEAEIWAFKGSYRVAWRGIV